MLLLFRSRDAVSYCIDGATTLAHTPAKLYLHLGQALVPSNTRLETNQAPPKSLTASACFVIESHPFSSEALTTLRGMYFSVLLNSISPFDLTQTYLICIIITKTYLQPLKSLVYVHQIKDMLWSFSYLPNIMVALLNSWNFSDINLGATYLFHHP